LRTFVDKIVIDGSRGTIHYEILPERWSEKEDFSILPVVPFGGAEVDSSRTPV